MIYTSGSTGKPKGVVIPHRGLANLIAAQRQTFGIRSEDRCLQFASLTFDASVFETMMAFHAGATLFVMETSVRRTTASGIASAIRERGVTVATLPPSVLSAIPAENLPSLRLLVSAGEACSASLVAKWKPGRQMFNAYGPTEATVWAATQRCRDDGQDPNLGRPIGNVGAYVVDERCELVPVGVAGELCLSGPGLAIEYHRRPDKTAEAFLPNPFDQRFDATLYRTGDRVRWNEEGNLEFLGRLDEQVKIGGHRIEPGEIASTIRNMPEVQDSCVSVRGDGAGRTLIAYVVPSIQDGIESVEPTAVRNYVKERLPTYMHPQSVVLIDQIPWNANGKVDYDRLPTGAPIVPQKSRMDHPLTKTEQDLAAIWKEVLQLESLSVDDNFFDLGGASLQALQAADLASQRGLDFSAERMFQYQTIAELASEIDSCAASQSSIDGTLTGGDGQTTLASETEWTPASALGSDPPDIIANEESVDPFDRSASRNELRMVVESIGMYLPEATSLTSDIVAACERPLDFPLERMTGIQLRHTGNGTEFSIDLARKAAFDCLQRSRFEAEEIDLLIAANISRYDGPDFQVSYEPSTASKLKQLIGATHAVAFDVCNACAGFFTALAIAETRLLTGEARRAMVVSGEYITHLSETAQREIDGFLDPRLACLTLGDAGAAVIVELADDGSGFETLDLYTAGKHHNLCVAKATDRPHGGAIMLTDAIKASAVTLDHSVDHAHKVMKQQDWDPESVQHLIMHQTSSTTLDGAVEELNRHFGKPICGPHNTVNNLRNRGNTATTTHWVAVMDLIREGRIQPGDKTVFAISGSGQTIGTALYRFDEMPNRMRTELALPTGRSLSMRREMEVQPTASFGVRIKAVGLQKESDRSTDASPFRVVETASAAASRCLHESQWEAGDVEWLVHCGVYRDEFLSEPAVAAILAGELKMNDDRPVESGARTLAFDVSDGARGPLTACALISDQIRSGMIQRGMVTSSEIENNPSSISQRGLLEMGSAIALERCEKGYGLGAFWFASFPQYAGAVSAATQMHDGKPRLVIETNEHVAQQFTACVVATAKQYLATVEREISDYSRILCAIPPSVDAGEVAARLRVSRHVLRVPVPHSKQDGVGTLDAFTAGLAVLWEECRQEAVADERWLLLAMGAGVEVACAEYRHEGSGSLEDA
jgi:3-oxoacyl-[acyl-carrier-protein] synthase III